jgi:hypothetical protein
MNGRIVLLSLTATFLLLALVAEASAQTRTAGVSAGNTFTYSPTVSWSSNDPTATPPSTLVVLNNTQWVQLSITAISGTNVTVQMTVHYKSGTENTTGGWVDVNSGAGENITAYVISANLAAGDSVYTSSPYNTTWIINETVPRTYSGVERETNHWNTTSSGGGQSYPINLYWDKQTGVLVEMLLETTNQTGAYTTTASEDLQITSSNVWTVPEFPTWTPALLTLIAATSAATVIARQRQPKRPPR